MRSRNSDGVRRWRSSASSWATRPSDAERRRIEATRTSRPTRTAISCVPGFVHGDATALLGVVADVLGEPDLGDQLGLDEVVGTRSPCARRAGR